MENIGSIAAERNAGLDEIDLVREARRPSLSGVAALIARGVCRHFREAGLSCLLETPLRSGRRADVMALGRNGEVVIVEIKSGPQDFRADRKWPEYRAFCDRFYFAVGGGFPKDLIPDDVGLIGADGYGAAVLREAPVHPLAGARRKAVTLRFARLSAARLQALSDPPVVAGL
ncbi:MmcB family DNA repair protein [Methylopila musalis]|uniref:MmcB family DNA repair protein n=1 Tax=Methylopila musalis TaxID=1134781 RepID=A0ABW3Z768_9HYPH